MHQPVQSLRPYMSHPQTALLVIDAQQSFEHRPYWSEADAPAFLAHLQALVDGAKARHIPVAQIFHVEESGAFSLEAGYVKSLAALSVAPDVTFYKHRHSALIGGGFLVWVTERGDHPVVRVGSCHEQ